jgi:hypothetical protein
LTLLEQARREGKLVFHGRLAPLAQSCAFAGLLREARSRRWVVYAKPPFGGPEAALKYLARYTHRIAIANSRLLSMDEESVRFTWKDYRHGNQVRQMRLPGCEFVRRFLLHALPKGFVRIRRYGILANCQREERLALCRRLLDEPSPAARGVEADIEPREADASSAGVTESSDRPCDACGRGRMRVIDVLRPASCRSRAPPSWRRS